MSGTSRAPRFPIQSRILWRERGTSDWAEGVSLNASATGVLFQCQLDPLIAIGTEVELIFAFSWNTAAAVDMADVRCSARTVRAYRPSLDSTGALVAAAIESYSFMPLG
jgi:hypothetical protein